MKRMTCHFVNNVTITVECADVAGREAADAVSGNRWLSIDLDNAPGGRRLINPANVTWVEIVDLPAS